MDRGLATATLSIIEQPKTSMKIDNPIPATTVNGTITKTSVGRNDSEIRVLGVDEYKEAALCLAEAFKEDHTTEYFVDTPDREHWTEEQKWDLHLSMMEYITYAHCLKGLVTTVGPDYGAVALWMPPGKNMDDLLTMFRSGLWRLNYKLSAEGKRRFFNEFLPLLHDTKTSVLGAQDDDSWYLVYIGTKPEARGRGYARKLIEQVTAMADAEQRLCYLESSNDVNPIIYGKMGFEIKRKIYLQRAEEHVELDIMVREPKAKRNSFAEKVQEVRKERI